VPLRVSSWRVVYSPRMSSLPSFTSTVKLTKAFQILVIGSFTCSSIVRLRNRRRTPC
jgi:hypothetical protein